MQDAKTVEKQLRIKTNSLVRYKKDLISYRKELTSEQTKLDKMMVEAEDEYTIKKYKEIIKETEAVIENIKGKFKIQREEVAEFILVCDEFPSIKETEQWEKTHLSIADCDTYAETL